jgi:hypothetical protein
MHFDRWLSNRFGRTVTQWGTTFVFEVMFVLSAADANSWLQCQINAPSLQRIAKVKDEGPPPCNY